MQHPNDPSFFLTNRPGAPQHQVPNHLKLHLSESRKTPASPQKYLGTSRTIGTSLSRNLLRLVITPCSTLPKRKEILFACDSTFSGGGDNEGSAAANSVMHALADGDRGKQTHQSQMPRYSHLEGTDSL
ncbi:hypothetical protein Tco_1352507 [Tanacetum coccineum]